MIAATFVLGAEDDASHPAARLRVRLADRALVQTNALIAVLSQLLELGTACITASPVLDLAGTAASGSGSVWTMTPWTGCGPGRPKPGFPVPGSNRSAVQSSDPAQPLTAG